MGESGSPYTALVRNSKVLNLVPRSSSTDSVEALYCPRDAQRAMSKRARKSAERSGGDGCLGTWAPPWAQTGCARLRGCPRADGIMRPPTTDEADGIFAKQPHLEPRCGLYWLLSTSVYEIDTLGFHHYRHSLCQVVSAIDRGGACFSCTREKRENTRVCAADPQGRHAKAA